MTVIVTNQYGTESYNVQNGLDDVTDIDHNTQTKDIISLARRAAFDSGGGEDGAFRLGVLSNPSGTVSASISGPGRLTGDFMYRVTFYNYSGETLATTEPGIDVSASSNSIQISGLPTSGQSNVITGRRVYRSASGTGGPWTLVAEIPDNTTTSFIDNNNYASGAEIPTSNTTGNAGTIGVSNLPVGVVPVYNFTEFTLNAGQSLTIPFACIFKVLNDYTMEGIIDGFDPDVSQWDWMNPDERGSTGSGLVPFSAKGFPYGAPYGGASVNEGVGGGSSGSTGTLGKTGASLVVICGGDIVSSGTYNFNGTDGGDATITCVANSYGAFNGGLGGAGGRLYLIGQENVQLTGTINCNGGDGGNGRACANGSGGSVVRGLGGYGGTGGFVYISGNTVTDSSTKNVSSGAQGSDESFTTNSFLFIPSLGQAVSQVTGGAGNAVVHRTPPWRSGYFLLES